jgi:integrase
MLFTGCRQIEARRAKLDAVTAYGTMGSWVKGKTKTGEDQELPLPSQLMSWLEAWTAIRPPDRNNPYFFSGQEFAQPVGNELVRYLWSELRKRIGITGLWSYDLRRPSRPR